MELSFSSNKMEYLQKIYQEVRHQEETTDTVIPDSFPDASAIADSFAMVFLRSKECQNNAALVTGAVKGGVLYTPEDGSYPRLLEFYLPVTFKFEAAELTDDTQLLSAMRISSVDARIINSRKVLFRVNLGCEIKAFQQVTNQIYELASSDERLQCRKNTITLKMPAETGEKFLTINEMVDMDGNRPPVVELCKISPAIVLTDRKLIGNKAVFKGNLNLKIMYRSENERLYLWKQSISFSQFCELGREYDEDELVVSASLSSCDVSVENGSSQGGLQIRADIMVQCTVYSDISMDLIEDAYCIRGKLVPQWASYALEARLDNCPGMISLHQPLQGSADEIIDTDIYTDFPVLKRSTDIVQMSIPVLVKVSAYTQDGTLVSFRGRTELLKEYQVVEDAFCEMEVQEPNDLNSHNTGTTVDVHCNFSINASFSAVQNIITLCGGVIEARDTKERSVPSVVLARTEEGSSLWDIGKKYGTSVSSLTQANHLENNSAGGRIMLIPID